MNKDELLDKYTDTLIEFNTAKGKLQEYIFDKITSGEFAMEDSYYAETLVLPMFIDIGGWECKGSPINTCCYNNYTDRANDHCIFCGHPDERK